MNDFDNDDWRESLARKVADDEDLWFFVLESVPLIADAVQDHPELVKRLLAHLAAHPWDGVRLSGADLAQELARRAADAAGAAVERVLAGQVSRP